MEAAGSIPCSRRGNGCRGGRISVSDAVQFALAITATFPPLIGSSTGRRTLPRFNSPSALAVEAEAGRNHAVLLANHGPVVAGKTLREAQYACEELEETAKLFLLLDGKKIRPLTAEQAQALRK